MNSAEPQVIKISPGLVVGLILIVMFLLLDWQDMVKPKVATRDCQQVVRATATIDRQQLAKLLTIPERDKKQRVKSLLKEPYCKLPSLEIRVGAVSEREAYPLAFDPQTWVIVLYEGEEYAGYQLSPN